MSSHNAEWRKKNPERAKEIEAKSRAKNREKNRAAAKAWREKNIEYARAKDRANDAKRDPATRRAQSKARRDKDPDRFRAYGLKASLKRSYGITVEDYHAMSASQNGVCAICRCPPQRTNRHDQRLHVDHDHATGMVRGLLCLMCNRAIGMLGDDPVRVHAAAHYLERGE